MRILVTILWLLGLLWSVLGRTQLTGTYEPTHSLSLSDGYIEVYWNYTDTDITFEVHGNTIGWVGIGLSPDGQMPGSDIVVGWVKDGNVKITDRYGDPGGNTFPPLDPSQDINVLEGAECDGWTMFKFSRQLAACEADYDREISNGTEILIWAINEADPQGDDIILSDYHGPGRGGLNVDLLSDEPEGNTTSPRNCVAPSWPVNQTRAIEECSINITPFDSTPSDGTPSDGTPSDTTPSPTTTAGGVALMASLRLCVCLAIFIQLNSYI